MIIDQASPFGPAIAHTVGAAPVTDWKRVPSRFLQDHTFTLDKANTHESLCTLQKK